MDCVDGGAFSKSSEWKTVFGDKYAIFHPIEVEERDEAFEHIAPPDSYDVRTFPRGKMVIVNIENFTNKSGYKSAPRKGTERDCLDLTELFLDLGFIVEVFHDVSVEDLLRIMKNLSQEPFHRMSALFMAFLTHGIEKRLYMADGEIYIKTITNFLRGSNLAGKPKVFLIQACQGSDYMQTLETDGPSTQLRKQITFPAEADFVYAYSTAYGYYSWRNGKSGSWFVQALCEVFRKYAHTLDVVRMLTKVNAWVCEQKSYTGDAETNGKRQVTSTVIQLRKELYLCPPVVVHDTSV